MEIEYCGRKLVGIESVREFFRSFATDPGGFRESVHEYLCTGKVIEYLRKCGGGFRQLASDLEIQASTPEEKIYAQQVKDFAEYLVACNQNPKEVWESLTTEGDRKLTSIC